MKTIYGALIKKQREARGLTLSELSDRCFIKEKYLQQAEQGELSLSHADLVLVCNALDVSSVGLTEGKLLKKPDVPELELLIRKLEEKAGELEESIREVKAAAASLAELIQMQDGTPEIREDSPILEQSEMNIEIPTEQVPRL